MAIMEINIIPIGVGTSLSKYIARAIRVLEQEREIEYELTPMGSLVQGDMTRLWEIAGKMHQAVLDSGVPRIETLIKIDDRRDKTSTMSGKVESVRRELAERD